MTLLVKARTVTDGLAREIRNLAQDQDPNVPVGQVQPLERWWPDPLPISAPPYVCSSASPRRHSAGRHWDYGLVSYWVTQRTYEIGLRVAIGATRNRIISMNGIVAGVIVALAATRFLASLLYGIGATDSLTFAAVD